MKKFCLNFRVASFHERDSCSESSVKRKGTEQVNTLLKTSLLAINNPLIRVHISAYKYGRNFRKLTA
jgi:hypothetical protein